MKKLRKEVTLNWILLMVVFVFFGIISAILNSKITKLQNEEPLQLYECEVTAWYSGQGYENHNIENVLEWELDSMDKEMTIEFVGGWIWINADDIDYICHTKD